MAPADQIFTRGRAPPGGNPDGAVLVGMRVVGFGEVYALFFTLALHLQGGHGWSPLGTAMAIMPWTVGIPLLSLGLADVPGGLAGAASGVIANVQHIGGSLGVATLGGLYVALPSGTDGASSLIPVLAGAMAFLACALPGVRLFPEPGRSPGGPGIR